MAEVLFIIFFIALGAVLMVVAFTPLDMTRDGDPLMGRLIGLGFAVACFLLAAAVFFVG